MAKKLIFFCEENFNLLDLAGPIDVFSIANQVMPENLSQFGMIICSANGGKITSRSGIAFDTVALDTVEVFENDIVWVVGSEDHLAQVEPKLELFIQQRFRQGVLICTSYTGIFSVAAALINEQLTATTHWRFTKNLESQYENVHVKHDISYYATGPIWSCAGSSTAIDMSLHLLNLFGSRKLFNVVSKKMVMPGVRREKEQQLPLQMQIQTSSSEERWQQLIPWIRQNISRALTVDVLANHMAMSPRNFTRHCHQKFGQSPKKLIDQERFNVAVSLVEQSDHSLSYIASSCGYSRAENMKRAFIKYAGRLPSEYKQAPAA
ncbi:MULTISPECIES: GlxA family transcriptional regulator [Vibrio]|uniref:GlxA family transcriptional regulator n=1 Tax=Vibrio TaxID=662 RepID=UPI0001B95808|nr:MULTISPECIES: helix-turn-helix domain-containing protein [Vibrio]EEX34320.1 transcriptional regulator AraC family [Vibrio coralliilyticus ATCC BAA-450]MDE3898363.1 helix-turn-helix domain-containing protein [Vibrio sp. CC007]